MQGAVDLLERFDVAHEVRVVSAHRTPDRMIAFGHEAAARGLRVLIAGAGGAAHLPGMLASVTTLPVPVATMAVNGARNAGLLAVRILGVADPELATKMAVYQLEIAAEAAAQDDEVSGGSGDG
jgi:5-(carboxyamino)imidazole ribonucleotide mutase